MARLSPIFSSLVLEPFPGTIKVVDLHGVVLSIFGSLVLEPFPGTTKVVDLHGDFFLF